MTIVQTIVTANRSELTHLLSHSMSWKGHCAVFSLPFPGYEEMWQFSRSTVTTLDKSRLRGPKYLIAYIYYKIYIYLYMCIYFGTYC